MKLKFHLDKSKFVEQGHQLSFSSSEESIFDISRFQEEKDVFSQPKEHPISFSAWLDLLPLLSNSRSQFPQEWNLVSIFHFDIKPSPFRTFGHSSPSASPGRYPWDQLFLPLYRYHPFLRLFSLSALLEDPYYPFLLSKNVRGHYCSFVISIFESIPCHSFRHPSLYRTTLPLSEIASLKT